MGELSRTAKYYNSGTEGAKRSKAKKLAYQKEYDKKPEQRRKRAKLVKINREADKTGVDRNGKDYDHAKKRYVKSSVNRGRNSKNGGLSGDIKSRG